MPFSKIYEKKKKKSEKIQITLRDFYSIRRSLRHTENEEKKKKDESIRHKVLNSIEDGLESKPSPGKGRGVFTTKEFKKGEYVVEYIGDLIDYKTAIKRESKYEKENSGSYIIDATNENGKMGRLLNHSRINFNLISKIYEIDNTPRILFFASRDISIDEELLYDYGDRSVQSLKNYPWLRF